MRKTINILALLALVALAAWTNGCLVEDREVQVVVNEENCEPIYEYHTSENYTTPKDFALGQDLDDLLADNDIAKSQIEDAFLVSASYEVIDYEDAQEWELEGVIMVQRNDVSSDPETLIVYTELTVGPGSVGSKVQAELNGEGVAIINEAIDDYLAGTAYPTLTLTVISGGVDPSPTPAMPLDFWWEACLYVQVIYNLETEIVNGL